MAGAHTGPAGAAARERALRAHGADAAAHDAAPVHKGALLPCNEPRRDGEDHADELGHERLHL